MPPSEIKLYLNGEDMQNMDFTMMTSELNWETKPQLANRTTHAVID